VKAVHVPPPAQLGIATVDVPSPQALGIPLD
jgi:hypothetical protein